VCVCVCVCVRVRCWCLGVKVTRRQTLCMIWGQDPTIERQTSQKRGVRLRKFPADAISAVGDPRSYRALLFLFYFR